MPTRRRPGRDADVEGEHVPLATLSNEQKKNEKADQPWNKFTATPRRNLVESIQDASTYKFIVRSLKILIHLGCFLIVLASAVIAKSTILLMTSQLKQNTRRPLCFDIPKRKRQVEISLEERIQWTWAILFCMLAPQLGSLLRSLRKCLFKDTDKPTLTEFLIPCFFQICHTVGLGLFTFCVLPSEHVINGVMMTNAVCLLPTLLKLASRNGSSNRNGGWIILVCVDVLAMSAQLCGIVLMTLHDSTHLTKVWITPIAIILTSFGWWENFVSKNSKFSLIRKLGSMHDRLESTRYNSYLYISVIKSLTLFSTMLFSTWLMGDNPLVYFDHFGFKSSQLNSTEVQETIFNGVTIPSTDPDIPLSISQKVHPVQNSTSAYLNSILIQIASAYLCYITSKFACRIRIQRTGFAFPLSMTVPCTISVLLFMCGSRQDDVCYAKSLFPNFLYWQCPSGDLLSNFVDKDFAWVWILLFLSQTWVVVHVWSPHCPRLASTELLFATPMYDSVLVDQSILLNRKKDDKDQKIEPEDESSMFVDQARFDIDKDKIPKIIICGTMWHEMLKEQVKLLKSLFRLDLDHFKKRWAIKNISVLPKNYYELETHIFFDDAFEIQNFGDERSPYVLNKYVQILLKNIEQTCTELHQELRGEKMILEKPKKYPTPYGGKLEWTLPGGTKLWVHLKNKDKIRHKKRWSQVMYMYYHLGFKIENSGLPQERIDLIKRNTFILALDGDIDFQPRAVELLLDRMKKDPKVGAACGRIHPMGSGLMVWYQKFEYAIGHWLQKATEHVIGCVLCSPGCFSLFRAEALMADRVMKRYTHKSDKPRDYVQYDQGEDRWLCTLLLQANPGWRVEYCAAADAYTQAPETFDDFFKQRRRWIPSTMANIMDLLLDYKGTIKDNDNISFLYIIYQMVLMIGSILGPGTIFLMLLGAFNMAFKIDNLTSFYINLIPLLLFMMVCYLFDSEIQLALGKLLSAIYALVMVAVIVALILQVLDDGLLAPSSLFLLGTAASFIIAALLHPQEILCLPHGIIYFLTIPAMYLLLIVFGLFNLNDIGWGTRENPKDPNEKDANQKNSFLDQLTSKLGLADSKKSNSNSEAYFDVNFGNFMRMTCCIIPGLKKPLVDDQSEKSDVENPDPLDSTSFTRGSENGLKTDGVGGKTARGSKVDPIYGSKLPPPIEPFPFKQLQLTHHELTLVNYHWLDIENLVESECAIPSTAEIKFWHECIEEYLEPIEKDKKKEEDMEKDLVELRNKSVGTFFMLNAVFVTVMFLLQMHKDKLFFEWPVGAKHNMTFLDSSSTVVVQTEKLQLEPLGLLFVAFYAVVISIQFICMIFHRFETFAQIMASTSIMDIDAGDTVTDVLNLLSHLSTKRESQETHDLTEVVEDGDMKRDTQLYKTMPSVLTLETSISTKLHKAFNSTKTLKEMEKIVQSRQTIDVVRKRMSAMAPLDTNVNYDEERADMVAPARSYSNVPQRRRVIVVPPFSESQLSSDEFEMAPL